MYALWAQQSYHRLLLGLAGQILHLKVEGFTDGDLVGSPLDRTSTTRYCTFLGGNLVTWKSKKQNVVAHSNAEAEYCAMAPTASELTWLQHFLQELDS